MKIYVALSWENDECSLCNKAFYTYEEASKYCRDIAENPGCEMYNITVELDEDGKKA